MKLVQRKPFIAILFLLLPVSLMVMLNFYQGKKSFGATNRDYRSSASGNWNSTATWQKYNGTSWVAATATPASTDGAITIQSGHTVTVTAAATLDQVTVCAGGQLSLSNGTLSVVDGTGDDLTVD